MTRILCEVARDEEPNFAFRGDRKWDLAKRPKMLDWPSNAGGRVHRGAREDRVYGCGGGTTTASPTQRARPDFTVDRGGIAFIEENGGGPNAYLLKKRRQRTAYERIVDL